MRFSILKIIKAVIITDTQTGEPELEHQNKPVKPSDLGIHCKPANLW